jgi:hypothetical protein
LLLLLLLSFAQLLFVQVKPRWFALGPLWQEHGGCNVRWFRYTM